MAPFVTIQDIDDAANFIRLKTSVVPRIGLVLGSGLGGLAEDVKDPAVFDFRDVPHFPISTVEGHKGRLLVGELYGKPSIVMQGRVHYYEGYPMDQITMPIRVMQRLGVKILILTNAAGAIAPDYKPGEVMVLKDHIALIGMAGLNPLRGPNLTEFGPRFPDMSQPYDRELIALAHKVAKEKKVNMYEGVYVCLSGPSFESPADLRFMRIIGADAVGMSTVSETIIARHGGTRVLAFSGISNKANLDGSTITTHQEVLEAGKMIVPKLSSIIRGVIEAVKL